MCNFTKWVKKCPSWNLNLGSLIAISLQISYPGQIQLTEFTQIIFAKVIGLSFETAEQIKL